MSKMKRGIQFILQQILGIRLYLYLLVRWQLFVQLHLLKDKEFLHFISLIPEKGVIGDIGANLGVTAVIIAKNKPLCKVVAFEPVPVNYNCCRQLFSSIPDDRLVLYELALSNCKSQLMMTIPQESGVHMHGLSKVVETNENNAQLIEVQSIPLDEIPEFTSPNQVVALKIDVENFEWYVMQGAINVISKQKPIIFCEVWNNNRKELTFELVKKLGYDILIFNGEKLVPYENQHVLNFFFLPNSSFNTAG